MKQINIRTQLSASIILKALLALSLTLIFFASTAQAQNKFDYAQVQRVDVYKTNQLDLSHVFYTPDCNHPSNPCGPPIPDYLCLVNPWMCPPPLPRIPDLGPVCLSCPPLGILKDHLIDDRLIQTGQIQQLGQGVINQGAINQGVINQGATMQFSPLGR